MIYQVDSPSLPLLFGLVGNYPVPLPAVYSSVSSSHYILLCLGLPFCILAVCGVLFIVECPHYEGFYGSLVMVSKLGKLVSVFLCVELDFFSLECNEVSSNEL